ncbi:MAG: hypothetical protein ACPG47_02125 [Leucothrix sp.]
MELKVIYSEEDQARIDIAKSVLEQAEKEYLKQNIEYYPHPKDLHRMFMDDPNLQAIRKSVHYAHQSCIPKGWEIKGIDKSAVDKLIKQ